MAGSNAIINFNKYYHWLGFDPLRGRDMFRDRLKSAISGAGECFDHDLYAETLSPELYDLTMLTRLFLFLLE
jgi:hypothetical protein